MNTRQTKLVAVVLIVLLATLFASTLSKKQGDTSAGGLLFPDLRAQINNITEVSIVKGAESLTLTNDSGQWVLVERQNYPVDTGKLRQVLLTLADATKLEQKTSNPELYEQLGVEDTAANSTGSEIRLSSPDSEMSLILGNLAQTRYRYARIPGQAESWLIDKDPKLPDGASDWLLQEILDIDTSRIRSVTIRHSDGETISVEKKDSEASNFDVPDIPIGRELSYAGIVNEIAGVLSKLSLQDVAKPVNTAIDADSAKTVFTTFDGLEITVDSSRRDGATWISVSAKQGDTDSEEASDASRRDDSTVITIGENQRETDSREASKINERLSGWEYLVQNDKGDRLRRRWDDILKAEE